MFDHVKFGVSKSAASKVFFLKSGTRTAGSGSRSEGEPSYGIELCGRQRNTRPMCLFQAKDKPAPLHIAFVADTPSGSRRLHIAGALEAGGKDNGAPGLRPQLDHANYYAAFVIGCQTDTTFRSGMPRAQGVGRPLGERFPRALKARCAERARPNPAFNRTRRFAAATWRTSVAARRLLRLVRRRLD